MRFLYPKTWQELGLLLNLAIPIVLSQFAQTGITLFEAIFAGHYPDEGISLSGVAIGISIWLPSLLFAQGVLSILTPIIAQLNGAGKQSLIAHQIRQGLIIATILSILLIVCLFHTDKIIALRSTKEHPIDPAMMAMASDFLKAMLCGLPGLLFYLVYRFQCEGISDTKPIMIIMFIALIFNVPLNYIFIYGKLGLPEFGGVGCGIAGAIIFWLMFLMIKIYVTFSKKHQVIRKTKLTKWIDFSTIKNIVRLGLPLGFAYFFEVTLFAIVALLIAPLGSTVVSAHQIMFQISSVMFAIPLSLGIATSIRVGFLLGQKKYDHAKYASQLSLKVGLLIACFSICILWMFKLPIIELFSQQVAIVELAMNLVFLLALYQIFDYLQVILSNILRAYEDTKSIFFITLCAYWLIGFPIGYILGLTDLVVVPLGAYGFWIGFNAGLAAGALMLAIRLFFIQKRWSSQKNLAI